MRFLDGAGTVETIAELTAKSRNARMAVAFWGEGAAKNLRLLTKRSAATVICNLRSGGTNPKEIRSLMAAGIHVSQCDTLHAKVYLFDNHVIIGSSNASANGLSFQGTEVAGWIEANVIFDEPAIYKVVYKWFQKLPTRKIEEDDLKKAAEMWSRRRSVIHVKIAHGITLVDALEFDPASFKGLRIYLCAFSQWMDAAGEKALEKERQARTSLATRGSATNLSAFQDWPELPDEADLVCFFIGPRGGVYFNSFFQMPKQRQEVLCKNKSSLQTWFFDQ
jgi:aconitase B